MRSGVIRTCEICGVRDTARDTNSRVPRRPRCLVPSSKAGEPPGAVSPSPRSGGASFSTTTSASARTPFRSSTPAESPHSNADELFPAAGTCASARNPSRRPYGRPSRRRSLRARRARAPRRTATSRIRPPGGLTGSIRAVRLTREPMKPSACTPVAGGEDSAEVPSDAQRHRGREPGCLEVDRLRSSGSVTLAGSDERWSHCS
jgi:hypothetical protein